MTRVKLLCFSIAGDEYALDIMRVREVTRRLAIRAIPGLTAGFIGVVHLRQQEVIPVLDLGQRFGAPAASAGATQRIIVCAVDDRLVGLLVDQVRDVVTVQLGDITPRGALGEGESTGAIAGSCNFRGRLLVLINLRRLLSRADRVALDQVDGDGATELAGGQGR